MEGRSNASLGHQNFNTCLADPRRQESDKKVAEGKNGLKILVFQETGTEQLRRGGVSSPCQKF